MTAAPCTRAVLGAAALVLAPALGCGVPTPPAGTGGGTFPEGPCGRGLVVVETDYQSTNVALVGGDGATLSGSFLSSASAPPGLVAPLSGDVVVPTAPVTGAELVLVDRYPAAVLSWVELATATVRAQLDVSTGFASNPQDYLALGPGEALVARYEDNPTPGALAFDGGSDLLVIDPSVPSITGRVDLRPAIEVPGYLPRPARLVATAGGRVFVLLSAYAPDFKSSLPSRLAEIDVASQALVGVTVLGDLHGCAALAPSEDGTRLAVACSGDFGGDSLPTVGASGLALVDVAGTPSVVAELPASGLGGEPLGFAVDFAGADRVLVTTLGHYGLGGAADVPDSLLEVDAAGQATEVRSAPPFTLGDVRCLRACGGCFVADAAAGVLARLRLEPGGVVPDAELVVESAIGLPPRLLGRF
ncbi:MAG: hypothetical protein IT373_34180 [Polyangiaceae bacterium]|nr:hypothetical protein [Polyangiaceae bacterium]